MKRISDKQKIIQRKISTIHQMKIDQTAGICPGCGQLKFQTPSHLIRRTKRPDLITEPANLSPDCVSCHHKWDSGNLEIMKQLNDFRRRMNYIKEVDPLYFNRLMDNVRIA